MTAPYPQHAALSTAARIPRLTIPIERFELATGATLLVSRRASAPIVALQAHIRGGPAQDGPGLAGTGYLAGALIDQGTKSRDERQIAEVLEPAGGEISGDSSGLSATIVRADWPLLVELSAEMLATPTYPDEEFTRQKKRLLDRLLIERDDPRQQGGLLFRELVYGHHWLGRAAYGSLESVRRIDARHVRAHHAANWVAKRAVIAVCGDVEPKRVKRELEKALAKWKTGTPLVTYPPIFPPIAPRVAAFRAERAQVHLYLGHLGIQRNDPDYAALVVMDHVLGTGPGFTNRISRRLRDELGLAYSVHAAIHPSAGILPGTFTAYIGTSPEHALTAVDGFRSEIVRLQTELVPDEELEIAKSYLVGSFALGFERAARRASYMISAEIHKFPSDHLELLLRQFAAVTPADVRRVAQKHLFPDKSVLVASGALPKKDLARMAGLGRK